MGKPNMKKLPRKWAPFMGIVCVCALLCLSGYWYLSAKTEIPAVAKVQGATDRDVGRGVGGEGTPEYNQMMMADNDERSRKAAEAGKSFIPVPVGIEKDPPGSLLEMPSQVPPKTETAPAARAVVSSTTPAPRETRAAGKDRESQLAAMMTYINNLRQAGRLEGEARSYTFTRAAPPTLTTEGSPDAPGIAMEGLIPGNILYAVNELTVSSLTPGTPVLATVVHGPLKGAKLLGTFQSSGERLVVQFTSLTKNGRAVQFAGYGIDPETSQASVATEIKKHTFVKWATFLAASFAEGLGTALQTAGTTHVSTPNDSWTFKDHYNTEEQIMVAGGKVGERLANQLEKAWDRPPTITLHAGTAIGILVIK